MNFFNLPPSLEEAIKDPANQVKLRLDIESGSDTLTIDPDAILSAQFQSGYDEPGCVISTGEVSFETPDTNWNWSVPGQEVKVFFTCGDCGAWLHRFTLYPDERGFRTGRSGGQPTKTTVALEDAAARMKRMGPLRDWSETEVVIDGVFADKAQPEKSLLHRIAARAGIAPEDIDCCTVPLSIPYAELSKSPWEELCDLAHACLATLESSPDTKLLFSGSPYQEEGSQEAVPYPLDEGMFYSLESEDGGDEMYNDIRLRWNKPERLERQEIWRYEVPPVEYDAQLAPMYRFSVTGEKRTIEEPAGIQARYRVPAEGFKNSPVVWADELDDLAAVEVSMVCDGPGLAVSLLDTTSYTDRAVVGVSCSSEVTLRKLTIWGRPVVMRLNQSCYRRDEDSVSAYGHQILNVTGRYFSDDLVGAVPHWEDWVVRRLENLKGMPQRVVGKTEFGVFHGRVGALVDMEGVISRVEAVVLDYADGAGFVVGLEIVGV